MTAGGRPDGVVRTRFNSIFECSVTLIQNQKY
ncbi:unknown [Prevotella sp. CAG:1058]|nr:unknown [Prevotella sp. CAG:1058]